MVTNFPTIAAPDIKALFDKPVALVAQEGLRYSGGALLLESSQPVVQRRVAAVAASAEFIGAFKISRAGKIYPGLVGLLVPTLDGEPINTTANVLDLTASGGTFQVWFKITFTPTYLGGFLASYTHDSVEIESGTSVPADTDAVKYLLFNSVFDGVPSNSYLISSIDVSLCDGGEDATQFHYSLSS